MKHMMLMPIKACKEWNIRTQTVNLGIRTRILVSTLFIDFNEIESVKYKLPRI